MLPQRTLPLTILSGLALAAVVALSGCSTAPIGNPLGGDAGQTGTSGTQKGDGGGGGGHGLPSAELPADFPKEVPLETEHIVKTHSNDDGWGVTMGVSDAAASRTSIPEKFAAAGFEKGFWNAGTGLGGMFTSERYIVTISFVETSRPGIEALLSYVVVRAP